MHMERVKGQQLHLRRVLDKQLEEITHDFRQAEAKREREIRTLGIDLTKLKAFTKDVDDVFVDNNPRQLSRRASLPAVTSPRPLTSPGVPPSTGRQRRLSVVTPPTRSRLELLNASTSGSPTPRFTSSQTSLDLKTTTSGTGNAGRKLSSSSSSSSRRASQSSADGAGDGSQSSARKLSSSSAPGGGMTLDDSGRRGSTATTVKATTTSSTHAQPVRRNSKSGMDAQPKVSGGKSPTRNGGERRSSLDSGSKAPTSNGKALRRGSKSSEADVSHNETKMYVHRDGQEPILVKDKEVIPDVNGPESSEDIEGSMFERKNVRRASEPALGGHFLRAIQAKANTDESSEAKTHHALSPADEELRKSIKKDLPSTIVAEEDEDRYNEENDEGKSPKTSARKTKDVETPRKEENKKEPHVKSKVVCSTSPRDANIKSEKGREKSKSAKQSGRVTIQEDAVAVTEKKQAVKPERSSTGKSSKQRRKSEGDVLRFARIWKLQAEHGRLTNKDGHYDVSKDSPENSEKMGIWDAVRKCRYIRGYNPPEMNEPEDLSEFVFGHPNPDSVIPTK